MHLSNKNINIMSTNKAVKIKYKLIQENYKQSYS